MSDTLDLDARCISHPERPAARACARCGDFICSGCVVSTDLCSSCKSRLFREGVPYSEQEKARARARRYRRTAERLLKALLLVGGIAVVTRAAVLRGVLPGPFHWLVFLCSGAALLAGLGGAVLALLGLRESRQGQPGPAVPGVFPTPYAVVMIIVGVAPTMLALLALSRLF